MKESKRIEVAARKKFLLDKISIARAPLGGWTVTVIPWKVGDSGVTTDNGKGVSGYDKDNPIVYHVTVNGETVTFEKL